jgi:hypothetical protein
MVQKIHPRGVIWGPYGHFKKNQLSVLSIYIVVFVIGDFIAMFTVFAALLFAFHFILVKIKPSLCYHDPIASDFDMYQMAKDVTSKFQKIATKRQPSLQKTVSFHEENSLESGDEAIYEEPVNVYNKQNGSSVLKVI